MILNLKNIQMTYIQKYVKDTKSLNDLYVYGLAITFAVSS